ncbi:MAG TPA: sulfatase-like hydrolase/transferase [Blastocatellia bacterium]|nr:sulfatase-like hydrolase/transferase [Blastocatellia bacterium]
MIQWRALRRVAWLCGFHLSFSLIFILFFSRFFTESAAEARMLVVFHLLVSVTFWMMALYGCGLMLRIEIIARVPALRLLVLLIPALSFNFLALLFTADWITNQFWGINVTDRMAWEFVRRFADYQRTLLPAFGWGAMALLLSAGVLCYIRLAGRAVMDCGEILVRMFQFQRSFRWPVRSALLMILFALIAGYGYAMVAFWRGSVTPLLLWRREPLTSFVVLSRPHLIPDNVRSILFPSTERRQKAAERDAELRRSYPRQAFEQRNVIMMIVDCLRADHLSFYGYERQTTPFLSRLQAEGRLRRVDEVRSDCNCTPCGVLSSLASRQCDDLGHGMFMLHDLLRDQGWRTNFILSGWHEVWYDLRELYGHSIDYYFEGTQTRRYLPDDDRLLLEGLEQVGPSDGRPAFFYFHLMSAHDVGVYSPEYARWQPALSFSLGGSFAAGRNDPVVSANTYDNKLLKADAIIEQLFAELDRKGYLRDSIVVILGDHGQALGEHDHYSHGRLLYEEDLRVPLLIVDEPGVTYRNLSAALQLDIAPTILDRLKLKAPESWRGRSLLRPSPPRDYTLHRGCQGGSAIIYRDGKRTWKYISSDSPRREELYELSSDPREQRNLVNEQTSLPVLSRVRGLMEQEQ